MKYFSFLNCSGLTADEESKRKMMYSSCNGGGADNEPRKIFSTFSKILTAY